MCYYLLNSLSNAYALDATKFSINQLIVKHCYIQVMVQLQSTQQLKHLFPESGKKTFEFIHLILYLQSIKMCRVCVWFVIFSIVD